LQLPSMSATHSAVGGSPVERQSSRQICPCKRSARPFLTCFPVRDCVVCCSGGIFSPGKSRRHRRCVLLALGVMGFLLPSQAVSPSHRSPRVRDTVQLDTHLTRAWSASVASQPFWPTQTSMCPLCAGEGCGCQLWADGDILLYLHVHALGTKELHVRTPMNLSTPVMPEKRLTPDDEGMQEYTDLARLCRRPPMPLALLAASGQGRQLRMLAA
jgi:hypothetical protein